MWLAITADPRASELIPTTIPGVGGQVIREGDSIVWNAAAAAFYLVETRVLTVTDVVPSQAIIGSPIMDVQVYGAGFTATTQVLWEGVPVTTQFLDVNKLRIQVDPSTVPARGFVVVGVQDGVVEGQGAAGFQYVNSVYDFGIGLSVNPGADPGDPPIVDLQPAGLTPALLGGVWVPPRGALQGLEINNPGQPGMLVAPPATETLAGVITEPPVGPGQLWARTNSGGASAPVGKWEPVYNIGTLTYIGAWKPATNDPNIHAVANKQNGDFWIVDCVDPLVAETPPLGSTPGLDNVMLDEGDWVVWSEAAQLWNHIVRTETQLQFRYGLIETGGIVDVTPATGGNQAGPPELGGVYATRRDDNQGLVIDPQGHISVPLATDLLAGSIVEPPPDDKKYSRTRTAAGVSTWVEGADVDIAGNVPAKVGVVFVPARNKTSQGLDLNADGGLYAPPATHEHLGTILEPPGTGVQFARFRDPVTGNNSWVPVAGGVIISDTPPPNPVHGMLWWESDSGDLFVYYDDGTSAQWVEAVAGAEPGVVMHVSDLPPDPMVAKPKDLWFDSDAGTLAINYQDVDSTQWVQIGGSSGAAGGITEAPIDTKQYGRQDGAWTEITTTGGLADAPNDGVQYTRGAPAAGGVNAWTALTAAATGDFLPRDGSLAMTGSLELDGPVYHSINKPLTTNWAGFFLSSAGANKWEWDLTDNLDNIVLRRFGPPTPAIVVQHEHISGATTYFGPLSIRGTGGAFPVFSIKDEFVGNDIWRISAAGGNLGILSFTAAPGTANPGDKFQLDLTNNRADFYCPVFVQGTPVVMMNEHQAALERIGVLEALLTKLQARLDKCCPE
jgi:hypothetical protein